MNSFIAIVLGLTIGSPTSANLEQFPTQTNGKVQVELRIPAGGINAKEEIDIEFRLGDLNKPDPILGPAGIIGATITAEISMPSMEGMPIVKPEIHSEGVPGDYGIPVYFPHGGQYKLLLRAVLPNGTISTFEFMLDVNDGKPNSNKRPQPYSLDFVSLPEVKAKQEFLLQLRVKNTKTKEVVTTFDVAHEKQFHLLIVSEDLEWFLHEHPVMDVDGTWRVMLNLPASGKYIIFGDVAPAGMGSQVVSNTLKASGEKRSWKPDWTTKLQSLSDGGISASIQLPEVGLVAGKNMEVNVHLSESNGGEIRDLQKYLGAFGHLMIFPQNGSGVIHSHPNENPETLKAFETGNISFMVRFPAPGLYRAFVQVKRGEVIHTAKFTFEVPK